MRSYVLVALIAAQALLAEAQTSIRPKDADAFDDTNEGDWEASSRSAPAETSGRSSQRPSRYRRYKPTRATGRTRKQRPNGASRRTKPTGPSGANKPSGLSGPRGAEPTDAPVLASGVAPPTDPSAETGPEDPDAPVDVTESYDGETLEHSGEEAEEVEPVFDPKAHWFNEYSEFSPPYIPYVPAHLDSTKYAICTLAASSSGDGEAGIIRLAQRPHTPVYMRITMQNMAADAEYEMRLRTYGYKSVECLGSGEEYNPLLEVTGKGTINPH